MAIYILDGIIAAATVIDAQVNYELPKIKINAWLGASNIGGRDMDRSVGAGLIGQQYFASWTINP
jgi:hypothetical protein